MVLREPQDEGVSPVVGMILVLGISIVGIAAILYWGLPAIDEMKANVEHRSVEAQFVELDASIKELVAGTTEKTAKRWQPSLHRGQVLVSNETEGWVYALETYNASFNHDFVYLNFDDGNAHFNITYKGNDNLTNAVVYAYRVNSTTSGYNVTVALGPSGDTQMTQTDWYPATGATKSFRLVDGDKKDVPIKNSTIRFRIFNSTTKLAEAWYIPTGRVDYQLDAGLGTKTVSENNGGVISGNGASYALLNSPPIPPVANTTGTSRFFARAVAINGTGSFAGSDRFDVLVTLDSTATLGSYDCAKADRSDCVESVKLFPHGKYADTWRTYLANPGRSYTFTERTEGSQKYLEDREGWMGFTLLQSIVRMTTQG